MRIGRLPAIGLALSAFWLVAGSWIDHRAREQVVEDYEKSVVYLCVHWSDGLPLMPRQSPEKCSRKHVDGNPVRQRFMESGWGEDIAVALIQIAGFWVAGTLLVLLFRRRSRAEQGSGD